MMARTWRFFSKERKSICSWRELCITFCSEGSESHWLSYIWYQNCLWNLVCYEGRNLSNPTRSKHCCSQLNYYINPELCVGGWAPSLRREMCITLIYKGHGNPAHTLCCRISYPKMYYLAQKSLFCALRQCFVHSPCRQALSCKYCLHVGQSINCSCLGCWFLISYAAVFIFTGSCDWKLMFC